MKQVWIIKIFKKIPPEFLNEKEIEEMMTRVVTSLEKN